MARQISVAEMQAPDVDYILPDGREIPDGLRKELEHFQGVRVQNTVTGKWGTRYRVPAHRAYDWLKEFAGQQ